MLKSLKSLKNVEIMDVSQMRLVVGGETERKKQKSNKSVRVYKTCECSEGDTITETLLDGQVSVETDYPCEEDKSISTGNTLLSINSYFSAIPVNISTNLISSI
jgi:hypothetical protein